MKEAVEFVPRASLRSPPTGTEKDQSKLRCRSGPAHRHRQFRTDLQARLSQPSVPLRVRQKVQEMLRQGRAWW
jgi:hypothetical protein